MPRYPELPRYPETGASMQSPGDDPQFAARGGFRPGSTGDFITSVANTFSSTPAYTVLNLTAGQLYGFRVTALTAAGPGATSSVATGTLALAQHQSWTRSAADQAADTAGADVRVNLAAPLAPAAAPAAASGYQRVVITFLRV